MANVSRRTASSWNSGKKCPYCSKDFFKADHFDRHVRSHTKEKPFSCKSCGKSYPRHDTMLRHIRTHHKGQTPSSLISNSNAPSEQSPGLRASSSSLDQQQPLPIYQSPNSLHGETLNGVIQTQNIQFAIDEVHENVFTQGNDLNFGQDTNSFMPIDLHQPPLPSLDWMDPISWLLQDDYDLDNFNQFIPGITNTSAIESYTDRAPTNTQQTRANRHRRIPDLRRCWFTQVSTADASYGSVSRGMSPVPNDDQSKDDIDENYRVSAASKLLPKVRTEPLPSIGLLNLFIHLFFTRFNIALPLVHGPTFKSSKENALLVLTICSAGSLWFGSKEATNAGSMLFERVNKAVLESPWERRLFRNSSESLNTLKVSLIGQTYGLLSGNSFHLETACAYHGAVLAMARRLKVFDETPDMALEANPSKTQLYDMWKKWARGEERKRLAACLYVHDAELAALFHHEPLLRHNTARLPKLSSPELFHASSAEAWYSRLKTERALNARSDTDEGKGSPSILELLSTVSGIGASIAADRRLNNLDLERQTKYEAELIEWYESTFKAPQKWAFPEQGVSQVVLNVLSLWHYTWISLYVDLNALELATGRDGSDVSRSTIDYVDSWVSSNESRRCLLHAWFLQQCIIRMPPGPAVALHIPRVLFSAAVVWHCFILHNPSNLSTASGNQDIIKIVNYIRSLPEVYAMSREREQAQSITGGALGCRSVTESILQLQETLGSVLTRTKQQTLHTLADLLRRSSSYGIGSKMADIIEIMLSHDIEAPADINNDAGTMR